MNQTPHISVVIPLYNKASTIARTIESVLSQTFKEFELIIVDDGSTDQSYSVASSISDQRIRLIRKRNGGVSSARNRGVQEARSEWIALLDADDMWDPFFLESIVSLIEEIPGCIMYGTSYKLIDENTYRIQKTSLPKEFKGKLTNFWEITCRSPLFSSSSTVLNRSSAISIGGFDETISMGEDLDMWFRMNLKGYSAFLNKPLAIYNLDASNRAMKKKHSYAKSIFAHASKYDDARRDNSKADHFFNYFFARNCPAILFYYNISDSEYRAYSSAVQENDHTPIYIRVFLSLPITIQRKLTDYYYHNRK